MSHYECSHCGYFCFDGDGYPACFESKNDMDNLSGSVFDITVSDSWKEITMANPNKMPPLETAGKYRIQGSNKPNLYYQFDWECKAVMNSLPLDYRPAVAFKPDGSIFMVREQPSANNYYFDLPWKNVFIVAVVDVTEIAAIKRNTTNPSKPTLLGTRWISRLNPTKNLKRSGSL